MPHHIERCSSQAAIPLSHCRGKEKKTAAKLARQPHAGDQAANHKVEHLKREESLLDRSPDRLIRTWIVGGCSSNHGAFNIVIVSIEFDVVPPLLGRDDNN